uniref:Uncharacterized protein n=1 Tax=Anguilla anguilla TaxID=7936 RepID=A0A0E9VLM8_ANGAN
MDHLRLFLTQEKHTMKHNDILYKFFTMAPHTTDYLLFITLSTAFVT